MKQENHWVLLQDQFPRIGSEFRQIEVSFGRKWIHIRSSDGVRYKVRPRVWNDLKSSMIEYWNRNQEETSSRFNTFTGE